MSDRNLTGRTSKAVEYISLKLREGSGLKIEVISAEVEFEALGMAQISWGELVNKRREPMTEPWGCRYVEVWWRFGGGGISKGGSGGGINGVEARPVSVEIQKSRERHVLGKREW